MKIYCCDCFKEVEARLTNGKEIYPHRPDLSVLPFWKCDTCDNFVGCHYKSYKPTEPLGCIPTPAIRNARQHIHRLLDPLWKSGKMTRKEVYGLLTDGLGWPYHTAHIKPLEEARIVFRLVQKIRRENV